MTDILTRLEALRRPALLVEAARIGAEDYRRERHLRRLTGVGPLPAPAAALERLVEIEIWMNDLRRARDAAWSPGRHVEVLIAILGEAAALHEDAAAHGATALHEAEEAPAQAVFGRDRLTPTRLPCALPGGTWRDRPQPSPPAARSGAADRAPHRLAAG